MMNANQSIFHPAAEVRRATAIFRQPALQGECSSCIRDFSDKLLLSSDCFLVLRKSNKSSKGGKGGTDSGKGKGGPDSGNGKGGSYSG
jgi:hypothetical protein